MNQTHNLTWSWTAQAPGVEALGLYKTFRRDGLEVRALDGIDLRLEPGSFSALLGPSGCGKTTLLRVLAGLEPARGGIIRTSPAIPPAVVFQDPRLLPWSSLERNLELALLRLPQTLSKAEKNRRIQEALELVGLGDRRKAWPRELSGGMAQRAGLARALCRESRYLLMDEPFSALDALTRERLQQDLKALHRVQGSTILFITHDIHEALALAERILVMHQGRIVGDLKPGTGNHERVAGEIRSLMGEGSRDAWQCEGL